MKIYTKTGDGGTTSLIGGRRVSKSDPRVEAYGSVDELMAHIAYLRDNMLADENIKNYCDDLENILQVLMNIAAVFATDDEYVKNLPTVSESSITFLENRIDSMQKELPKIDKFTIPGGHPLVSLSHIARTVCRRTERCATKIESSVDNYIASMHYLNRLSDYLYILGRKMSQELNIREIFWIGK